MVMYWIPVDEAVPEVNDEGYSDYILLSFANAGVIDVGRYEVDKDGGGAFYIGDDEKSCSSWGLLVNAWMPCPERYDEDAQEEE